MLNPLISRKSNHLSRINFLILAPGIEIGYYMTLSKGINGHYGHRKWQNPMGLGVNVNCFTLPFFLIGIEFDNSLCGAPDDLAALAQISTGDPKTNKS